MLTQEVIYSAILINYERFAPGFVALFPGVFKVGGKVDRFHFPMNDGSPVVSSRFLGRRGQLFTFVCRLLCFLYTTQKPPAAAVIEPPELVWAEKLGKWPNLGPTTSFSLPCTGKTLWWQFVSPGSLSFPGGTVGKSHSDGDIEIRKHIFHGFFTGSGSMLTYALSRSLSHTLSRKWIWYLNARAFDFD